MSLTLYHYVHCPFCIRVRMAFGYLKQSYTSRVLDYDDEATPLKLTGVKILPALETNGKSINESLDIIALVDKKNTLKVKETMAAADYGELEKYLSHLGNPVHSLAMPYWIWTPEFTPSARQYFQLKKEQKRGPFRTLVRNQLSFMTELKPLLERLEAELGPFYQSEVFGLKDILLAAHVWGLYVVPEFQFSPRVHEYLQSVKQHCSFNYHQDFWS